MFQTSEKLGRGKCVCCGDAVTYRKSKGGKVTFRCDSCDMSGFMEHGGGAHQRAIATIAGSAPAENKPAPAGAPAPKPKAAAFSMQAL